MYLTLHKEKANEGTLYHKLTVIFTATVTHSPHLALAMIIIL